MLLASLQNVRKEFGADSVLNDVTLKISENQKLGLIGPNGSGKTTLIRILIGDEPASGGTVTRVGDIRIGHVQQHVETTEDVSVLQYALGEYLPIAAALKREETQLAETPPAQVQAALESYQKARDAYDRFQGDYFEDRAAGMLDALGLAGKSAQSVQTLSGGEKNILSMARALLREPDLLVLDEPGNHLDFNGVAWLEAFLSKYKSAVLIISHNRYLLDRVVDGIYHLEDGKTQYYDGGYSRYRETRLRDMLAQQADFNANQKRLAQLEALVKKFEIIASAVSDPAWGKRLRARRSQLNHEQKHAVDKPRGDDPGLKLDFQAIASKADIAVQIRDYSKAFGDSVLFDHANLEIRCGERVALVGPNGSGKSTLLKEIITHGAWDASKIRIGPSLKMYYCAQEQEILHPERTIMEEIRCAAPFTRNETAKFMSRFQFGWDDLQKPIGALSGGERNRVQLALMMLAKPNFLILDEPTNHLDIPAREAVEEALAELDATVLIVSHDRYFLDKLVNRVVEIKNRGFVSYTGSFTEYWYAAQKQVAQSSGRATKRRHERERTKPREKPRADSEHLENKIQETEQEKLSLERFINDAFQANDYREGRRLGKKLDQINTRLDELYAMWLDLE